MTGTGVICTGEEEGVIVVLPSSSTSRSAPPFAAHALRSDVDRVCVRLGGMSTRLETVENLIPIDAASASRRVRAAVEELDRIVESLRAAAAGDGVPRWGAQA